jgi:UDP-N-acetylglucosamine 2-epimerase (non-hydrolysing)
VSQLVVIGTRPEAVKLAPVVRALRERGVDTDVLVSGQHADLVRPVLEAFSVRVDHALPRTEASDLATLTGRLLVQLGAALRRIAPSRVVVHGDTATALAASLAAFYAQLPLAHVEAGLRTGALAAPFPEEANRVLVDRLSDLWFAPTPLAARALLAEGIGPDRVHITGNTGVDAARWMSARAAALPLSTWASELGTALAPLLAGAPPVLVTAHRRESIPDGLIGIATAVRTAASLRPDVHWLVPLHPNPRARAALAPRLADLPAVHLLDPLPYAAAIRVIGECVLVLTDSGGLQEEAPSLDTPVVVLRDRTERTEGVDAGWLRVVGTSAPAIVAATLDALDSPPRGTPDPFGDGHAAERIAAVLAC